MDRPGIEPGTFALAGVIGLTVSPVRKISAMLYQLSYAALISL